MRIQNNNAANNALRQYSSNNTAVSKSLEKLSSGYQINRAGDDAAGLAISEKMRAQITGLETATDNANDGISLVQTAEGALTEVHSMLNRMVELATQSANGTYDNETDRANLQKEVESLQSEINRISESTNYNGIKLLDGSVSGSSSAGELTGSEIVTYKGAATAAVPGTDASATHTAEAKQVSTYDVSTALTDGQTFKVGGITITAGDGDPEAMTNATDAVIDSTANGTADEQGAKLVEYLNNANTLNLDVAAADYTWSYDSSTQLLTATAREAGSVGAAPTDAARALTDDTGTKAVAVTSVTTGVYEKGIDFFDKDTINVDGTEVSVDWSKLSDADKATLQKKWTAVDSTVTEKDSENAAKVLQDTINSAIDAHNAANGTSISQIKVDESGADDEAKSFTFTSGQKDGDSKISFTGTANSVLGQTVGTGAVETVDPVSSLKFSAADAVGSFTMKLDDQTLDVTTAGLSSSSTVADVETALQSAIDTALANYDTANKLTGDDAVAGKIKVKVNSDGALEFTNTTDKKLSFEDKEDGEVAKTLGISTEGKSLGSGGLTLQVGDTSESYQKVTVSVDDMSAKSLGIEGISVATQTGASSAIDKIKAAINTVSSTRGDLGAVQNRLEHTISNLGVATENMTAAESRIRDVDMAEEMMEFTKNNILTQASQAMLAQANQLPQGVLQLLQ
ncbi:MAG: hypothetical protein EOM28_07795 [Clostridia bacterium]|nr:hypothetical protein [Clostridia bacterium]